MSKQDMRATDGQLSVVVYVSESGIHGKGVFAATSLRKGDYIGTFSGPVAKRNGTYVLWAYETEDAEEAVGRSGRNMLRFLNHALSPNAEFDGFELYARRRIRPDEEITIDYGWRD